MDTPQNKIEFLEMAISFLECGANSFYAPHGSHLKGWNTVLEARDNLKILLQKEQVAIAKAQGRNQ